MNRDLSSTKWNRMFYAGLSEAAKEVIRDRYETKIQLLRRIAATKRSHTITPSGWVWGKVNVPDSLTLTHRP